MTCSIVRFGAAGVLVVLAAGCSGAPEPESPAEAGYTIDFDRSVEVGDRWTETSRAAMSFRESAYGPGGQGLGEESAEAEVRLVVDAEVLEVSSKGKMSKMRYTVRSMTANVNGSPAQAIAPGTVIEVTADPVTGEDRRTGVPDNLNSFVASLARGVMGAQDPNTPTEGEATNPPGPVEVGKEWPIETETFRKAWSRESLSLAGATVDGRVRLSEVIPVRGIDCFSVSTHIEAEDVSLEMPPGFAIDTGTILSTSSIHLPVDPERRRLDDQTSLFLNIEASAANGVSFSRVVSIETDITYTYPNA